MRCSLVAVAVGLVFGCFVSGCGRLSFEGDGSGPGSTPQLEITPPVAISLPGRRAVCPTVVWNGSGWAVAWLDGDRDSYFVLLDAAGVPQGNITAVANERFLGNCPSLIWTGTEYVVTLDRQVCVPHSVEVHRFSADGARLGTVDPASPLGADAFDPSIAWNGSGFHLSWTLRVTYPTPDAIRFAQLDAAGKPIGTDYPLSMSPTFAHYSTVLGTPPRSVAVWGEERAVRFATLEAGAVTRQMPILTTGRLVEPVAAAWTGSELGLAWLSDPFHLWFVLADPATGITTVPDETAEIIGQIKPRLAAYPKGFGLVLNYPMAIPSLKFALRDTSGAKVGDATPLSDAGRFPALAFGGDRFAVVYIDQDRVQLVFIKP